MFLLFFLRFPMTKRERSEIVGLPMSSVVVLRSKRRVNRSTRSLINNWNCHSANFSHSVNPSGNMASKDGEPPNKVQKLSEEKTSKFSMPFHFSDMILVIEGRNFHVHKGTLSMASPVFETMFSSNFKEKNANEINLPDKKADEFEILLNIIYNFKDKQNINALNYRFLLKLADEYQIQKVTDLCEEFINNEVSPANCIEFFNVSHSYGLQDVMEYSLGYASRLTIESIQSSPAYPEVTDEAKVRILTERLVRIEGLLNKYFSTCSKFVEKTYNGVIKRFHKNFECQYQIQLHRFENVRAVLKKKFDVNCVCCTSRIENEWPENASCSMKYLKDPLVQLNKLCSDYKDLNLPVD